MKILSPILLLLVLFTACGEEPLRPPVEGEIPIVFGAETYDIIIQEGITYAEGLSHESINSENATPAALQLDVFLPDNALTNRPAIMLIHGGGFISGNRSVAAMVTLARHFAARGWVAFSIDYRLRDDFGTVPEAWEAVADTLDPSLSPQFLAMYPAHRDAKAALRWIVANAEMYNINTDYITVGGGSAGAITAIGISLSEASDFNTELSLDDDPTLATTHQDQAFQVQSIIDFWGSKISLDALEMTYGPQEFDTHMPPIMIVHGTEDSTVPFSGAEELQSLYEASAVSYDFYPLEGKGHGAWNATVGDKRLEELAFDFVVKTQELVVE